VRFDTLIFSGFDIFVKTGFQMSCYRTSTLDRWTANVGDSDWRVTTTLDIALADRRQFRMHPVKIGTSGFEYRSRGFENCQQTDDSRSFVLSFFSSVARRMIISRHADILIGLSEFCRLWCWKSQWRLLILQKKNGLVSVFYKLLFIGIYYIFYRRIFRQDWFVATFQYQILVQFN